MAEEVLEKLLADVRAVQVALVKRVMKGNGHARNLVGEDDSDAGGETLKIEIELLLQ